MWMVEPWKVQPRPRCGLKYRHALHVSSSVACALVCPRHPHYFSIERRSRWRAHPWARQRSLPLASPPSSPDLLDGGAVLEAPPSSPDRPAAGRRGSAAWRRDGQAVRGSPNEWRTLSQRRRSCPSIPGHRPTPLPQTRPAQCPPHRVAHTWRGQSGTRPSVRRVRGSPNSSTPHAPCHAPRPVPCHVNATSLSLSSFCPARAQRAALEHQLRRLEGLGTPLPPLPPPPASFPPLPPPRHSAALPPLLPSPNSLHAPISPCPAPRLPPLALALLLLSPCIDAPVPVSPCIDAYTCPPCIYVRVSMHTGEGERVSRHTPDAQVTVCTPEAAASEGG